MNITCPYIEDIIYSESLKDHLVHIDQVLGALLDPDSRRVSWQKEDHLQPERESDLGGGGLGAISKEKGSKGARVPFPLENIDRSRL